MSASPSQQEMKRIFEKSIRLLDSSQSQLKDVRTVLKKSVINLAQLNSGKLIRVNEILASVVDTVEGEIDVNLLEKRLQELVSVLNSENYSRTNSDNLLQISLEQRVGNESFLSDAQQYRDRLLQLSDKQISEDELSKTILDLFAEVAESACEYELLSDSQLQSVKLFAANVADAAGLNLHEYQDSSEEILGHLFNDLKPYIGAGRAASVQTDIDASSDEHSVNVNHLLIEFVNNLSLHDSVKDKRKEFNAELNYPVKTSDDWRKIISKMDDIVNDSIAALEAEKQLLQSYVARIIKQLAEIEVYVKSSRAESSRALEETTRLNHIVNSDVENISELVSDADNLESLQQDVQTYLDDIRSSVDANMHAAEERDLRSLEGYSTIIAELTDAQRESENLKAQLSDSHTRLLRDDLTGLPNRMAFNERVNAEYNRWMRDKPPLSLAIWDIDHFKSINDTYGHDVGDRVLKIVAKIIHSRVRKTDMFARYGGEEFVFMMPDTAIGPAIDINDQLREKLAEAGFHYDGDKCMITSSVGIATFREGDTVEDVMKRADIALYRSKDRGRNQCSACDYEVD